MRIRQLLADLGHWVDDRFRPRSDASGSHLPDAQDRQSGRWQAAQDAVADPAARQARIRGRVNSVLEVVATLGGLQAEAVLGVICP